MPFLPTLGLGEDGTINQSELLTTRGLGDPGGAYGLFFLDHVVQLTATSIRATFSLAPLAVNPAGAHDALNVAFYTLTGPATNIILLSATVPGDPLSIDFTVTAPFVLGTWTLTAYTDIQMANTTPLAAPLSQSFQAIYTVAVTPVADGAQNDNASYIIRKHLNPALKGPIWNALIAAIATGDDTNWTNAQLAFDQLFKSSASGIYLDRRCADDGIVRPANIGMPDELFSQYAIKTTTQKLTQEVMLEILETFYGSDAVRAYVESVYTGPFDLHDGDELDIYLDERDFVKVVFKDADFAITSQASAVEVAAAITREFQRQSFSAFSVAVSEPVSGDYVVRIYSASLGLTSSVRVNGSAQRYLHFPDVLVVATASITSFDGYSWTATVDPVLNHTTFSLTSTTHKMDLSVVQTGDWVIIDAADSGMPAGVWGIVDAAFYYSGGSIVQTFTVEGNALESLAVSTLTATQQSANAYLFFRPTRHTIQRGNSRTVIVSQSVPEEVDISIPATTQAVGRGIRTAAYCHLNDALTVTGLMRLGNVVTVTAANTLSAGDQVYLDDASADISSPPPITSPGSSDLSYCVDTLWSPVAPENFDTTWFSSLVALSSDVAFRIGGYTGAGVINDTELFPLTQLSPGPLGERRFSQVWTGGPTMLSARMFHSAVVLPPGRVVVFGGNDGSADLATIELFNSVDDPWVTSAATMNSKRSFFTADLLANGKVLLAGGFTSDTGGTAVKTADLYDTLAGTVAATGAMAGERTLHASAILPSGKVLVCGGRNITGGTSSDLVLLDANGTISNTSEVYDPTTGLWTQVGSMSWRRYGHRLVPLADGRLLCVGGYGYPGTAADVRVAISACEVFDAGTGQWSPACHLSQGVFLPVAKLLPTCNKVVVAFGLNAASSPLYMTNAQYIDGATLKVSNIPNPFVLDPTAGVPDIVEGVVLDTDVLFVNGGTKVFGVNPQSALLIHGDDVISQGGLNGIFEVATATGSSFTFLTPEHVGYSTAATATIVPVAAEASTTPGPYILEPDAAPGITASSSTTTVELVKGHSYLTLPVADSTQFPDEEGYLCLAFGTDVSTSPVRYLGRYSPTALVLDYQFKMPFTIPVGSSVVWLVQKGPWAPANPEDIGAFYLTDSPAGRVAAVGGLEDAVAAGINMDIAVVYPGGAGLGNEGHGVVGEKISDAVRIWSEDYSNEQI